jgi:UDP-glucuronate 4-epimerase
MSKILVTGSAGFIGYHLVNRLLAGGHDVTGLDNINSYYDINLKFDRLTSAGIERTEAEQQVGRMVQSRTHSRYRFIRLDLENGGDILDLFKNERFDAVVHLAAQAGVRYSISHPHDYISANITGFLNILEGCRHYPVKHLIYASSSSVYGANKKMPFSVHHNVDHPMSLYAATKKANELMAHTYANLFSIPSTGLRFFTVYGPWGRPDMALFLFTNAMFEGRSIDVYNNGQMARDFTYIDDIVESISRLIPKPPVPDPSWDAEKSDPATSFAPYQVFNIGSNNPVRLMDFISEIEKQTGITAEKHFMPMQAGDVPKSWADVEDLFEYTGYRPQWNVEEGIRKFVDWYRDYYKR